MKLKRTKQCDKCPWKKSTNPHEIPNGYDARKHAKLKNTITKDPLPDFYRSVSTGRLHIMACHETDEAHCVGWLVNQLGPGNNIALRLALHKCDNLGEVETFGEQHERFEDTLPD